MAVGQSIPVGQQNVDVINMQMFTLFLSYLLRTKPKQAEVRFVWWTDLMAAAIAAQT